MTLNLTIGLICIVCGMLAAILFLRSANSVSKKFRTFYVVAVVAYCLFAILIGSALVAAEVSDQKNEQHITAMKD